MLGAFLQKYNERKAVKEWKKSTLGQALALHTQEYFYGKVKSLSGMSEGEKQKLIGDFYGKVASINQAENPFLKLRELLATYVVEFSKLQVLCLTKEEKVEQFYADCPYISGELHLHIRALTDHNKELKELKWSHEDLTEEELIGFCNGRSALLLYYMNGINVVRIEAKDRHNTKDWFKPFVRAMLIWDEDTYRSQIGLPSLLPGSLDALEYSTFMNMVVNGIENPLYAWEMAFKDETQR